MSTTAFPGLKELPEVSSRRIAVHIHSGAERKIRQNHPWVFENSIRKQSHEGQSGDLAVIFDRQNRFLAVGLYDPFSSIRVRVLQAHAPAKIDRAWFFKKMKEAIAIRRPLRTGLKTGYRVIHGENDGLPGLALDRYDNAWVFKIYTSAWIPYLGIVIEVLCQLENPRQIILRVSGDLQKHTQRLCGLANGTVLFGSRSEAPACFMENNLYFEADLFKGQKTGFFFDQRENRMRVEKLAEGKKILDVFCNTGAFSLYGARGKAREITCVDVSPKSLDNVTKNFSLNQSVASVRNLRPRLICEDAFASLECLHRERNIFDLVIIDPPSFAKKSSDIHNARQAYVKLASAGMRVLRPGGVIVMASCSTRICDGDFFGLIHQAAGVNRRTLSEIERTAHALDHPIGFAEGSYLKCLFAVVL